MNGARIAALHAALLLGAMSAALPATAQSPVATTSAFAPPEGEPMLLTRTLRRELSDGKAIVATRTYRVSFARSAGGWTVDGVLIASEIEAPPAVAALASIERQRPDDALFPIRLDPTGVIQPRANPISPDGASWRAAFDVAIKLVSLPSASGGTSPGPVIQQLQSVAGAGSLSIWPVTLFLPRADTTREERRFALPEGGEGVIVTELERLPADGLDTMGKATRTVVTQVAGTRRVTHEQWSLKRIGG
jgi:hypothetical protein